MVFSIINKPSAHQPYDVALNVTLIKVIVRVRAAHDRFTIPGVFIDVPRQAKGLIDKPFAPTISFPIVDVELFRTRVAPHCQSLVVLSPGSCRPLLQDILCPRFRANRKAFFPTVDTIKLFEGCAVR